MPLAKFTLPLNHSCIDALVHCFTEPSIHWFIDSLNHRFIDSLIHSFVDSLIHWFIGSLIHWFIDPLVYWIVDSFIHWCSDLLIHWFFDSLDNLVIDSLTHCLIGSFLHWLIDWSIHRFIRSIAHCFFHCISLASRPQFAHSLMHLKISTLHCFCISKNCRPSISWFLIAISFVRNFCPGMGRALSGIIYLIVFVYRDRQYPAFNCNKNRIRKPWDNILSSIPTKLVENNSLRHLFAIKNYVWDRNRKWTNNEEYSKKQQTRTRFTKP
jgi:hypothetical protein